MSEGTLLKRFDEGRKIDGDLASQCQLRVGKRSQQPWPDRALMIGGVALDGRAAATPSVMDMTWIERSQSKGSEELILHSLKCTKGLSFGEKT